MKFINNIKYVLKKYNFLIKYIDSDNIILVDDDNQILKYIYDKTKDIILYQDSELVD